MPNDIFRFMTVRPPQRADPGEVDIEAVLTHRRADEDSQLLAALREARHADDARQSMNAIIAAYTQSPEFVRSFSRLPIPLAAFDAWLAGQSARLNLNELSEAVKRIFDRPANKLVSGKEFRNTRRRIADSLLAASIQPQNTSQVRPRLLRAMRLLGLLERMAANDADFNRPSAIQKALRALVLLPGDLFPLPPKKSPASREAPNTREDTKKRREAIAALAGELKHLKAARDEIVGVFNAAIDEPDAGSTSFAAPPPSGALTGSDIIVVPASESPAPPGVLLSKKASQQISEDTKRVLVQLGIQADEIGVPKAVERIEARLSAVASELYTTRRLGNIVRIGGAYLPANQFYWDIASGEQGGGLPGLCPPELPEPTEPSSEMVPEGAGTARPVGIADLMVVEQEIRKYEMGEIAHIENVLRGEAKERKHRRARTTEESILIETERTTETERDLQTTERFELQTESQQVLSEDTSKEVGVTVNVSYGPSVEVTLNTNFATNSAQEDTRRTATAYARDVTSRAASRVQERVLERRFRRTVEEIEEINTHTLDNRESEAHVVGIYRWVDKIYKAQIVNYGRRMMFEFVVPEPAAFLRYALSAQPVESVSLEKPDLPGYCVGNRFEPLTAEDIDPENYLFWVSKYSVSDIEPSPPFYKWLGSAVADSNLEERQGVSAKTFLEIEVPPGYVARWAGRTNPALPLVEPNRPYMLDVFIDNKRSTGSTKLTSEINVVPVSTISANVRAYAINIIVLCERTPETYQAWQIKTYNAIMIAYQELKARYEEKLEATQVQAGISISGRNPLLNREIEKIELKKLCLSLLTGQHFDLFDAMRRNVAPNGYPQLDLTEAEAEGRYLQFFEQAFEWVHIMYVFYPYFWGMKAEWPALSLLDDTDPLFARFLQAGAARVQVPVRPGYEEVIAYYMESGGEIWDGGDPPHIEDELYVSIIDEIREQQGAASEKTGGTLAVTNGSASVTGVGTDFDEDDIDRRITIEGERHRIAEVVSPTSLTLTEPYRGSTQNNARYTIGVKLVGEPWEVRVPTSLVILQEDASLPDWTVV